MKIPPKDYCEVAENEKELGLYEFTRLDEPLNYEEHLIVVKGHRKGCNCQQCLKGMLSQIVNVIREQYETDQKLRARYSKEGTVENGFTPQDEGSFFYWLGSERRLEQLCLFTRHIETLPN